MTNGCKNCKHCQLDKSISRGLSCKSYVCNKNKNKVVKVDGKAICKDYIKKDFTSSKGVK